MVYISERKYQIRFFAVNLLVYGSVSSTIHIIKIINWL